MRVRLRVRVRVRLRVRVGARGAAEEEDEAAPPLLEITRHAEVHEGLARDRAGVRVG